MLVSMRMDTTSFISARQLASRLGLPLTWLRGQAEAGCIPCLKAGRRLFFDEKRVRAALVRIAAGNNGTIPRASEPGAVLQEAQR